MRREFDRQQSLLETAGLARAQVVQNWLLLLATRLTEADGSLWDPCLIECEELESDCRGFEQTCMQVISRLRPTGTELKKVLLMSQFWAMLRQCAGLGERIAAVTVEFSYIADFHVPGALTELALSTGEALITSIRALREWDTDVCVESMEISTQTRRQAATLQQVALERLRGGQTDVQCLLRLQLIIEWLSQIAENAAAFSKDIGRAVAECPASQIALVPDALDDLRPDEWVVRAALRV